MKPQRGEAWLFDCGMAEKVRPVLILSVPFADADRAVVTVVFHSTALRGSDFEVLVQVPFLQAGAFIAQSLATYPLARAIRSRFMGAEYVREDRGAFHEPVDGRWVDG